MTGSISFADLTAAQARTTELMATGASRDQITAAAEHEAALADAFFEAQPDAGAQLDRAAAADAAEYEAGHPAPPGWLGAPTPEPAAEYEAEAG
jgi:hypothetical protein